MKEFNAKYLIFNKFGNPDPAKALSWVVDKKDARIIISNEIDGDKSTKLNGVFIKSLASGGDAMEGRRLFPSLLCSYVIINFTKLNQQMLLKI